MPLDVGALLREQRLEDAASRLLVQSMIGWSGGRGEGFFEEGHADAFGPADSLQFRGCPRLALHHLGKQGEADADNFVFLGQTLNGLLQELLLVICEFADALGQDTECPSQGA